jgi:glycerophosphoryl diester phosphodiesterase
MKLIDKYNKVKQKNNNFLILIKSGVFYETFNNDAYIMNYLFNYKIKQFSNYIMVGFPQSVIENIKDRLNKEKVPFIILGEDQEEILIRQKYNEYNYKLLLDISNKYYNVQSEINKITDKLEILKNSQCINDIIDKIKEII